MKIERKSYLDQLVSRKWNGMIKVVAGMRRSGKSYLLFRLFVEHLQESGVDEEHIVRIELDRKENARYRSSDALYDLIKSKISGRGKYYVLIDEIQLVGDDFYEVLNSLLHYDNVDTYVTGSNSRFLVTDIVTEFRGRSDTIMLWPLSFDEWMSVGRQNWRDGWTDYFTFGGLPKVREAKTPEERIAYLRQVFAKTYLSDVVERNRIRNVDDLNDIVAVLASGIGSLTNVQKIADTFKTVKGKSISKNTVARYIAALENAFLIQKARRYNVKGRKYIGAQVKYYFTDVGIRNCILGFRQQEESHIMENVIYNELRRRGWEVDVGVVETWDKSRTGSRFRNPLEIDFVCNKGSARYYIQSAFMVPDREKMAQEQRPFSNVPDSFRRVMIVKDAASPWYNEQGTLIVGLNDFLFDASILERTPADSRPASPQRPAVTNRNAEIFDRIMLLDSHGRLRDGSVSPRLSKKGVPKIVEVYSLENDKTDVT